MLGQFMESEIRRQPQTLAQGATRYFAEAASFLAGREFDMVLLAARGSSDNAALYARYLLEIHLRIPVVLAAPSVLTRYGSRVRYPRTLAIGISQSGAAPDVAEVLAALRADGHATLAVTNTPGSRLTQEAEHTVLLDTGTEQSVAATMTYSASLLALHEVVRAAGANLPNPKDHLPTDGWVERAAEAAHEASGVIVRSQPLFALSRGYGFATSHETALKLMECALLPCKAYSSADFEHGPKALAGHGSAAISFEGSRPDLAAQGCNIVVAPEAPTTDVLCPIWDVIFSQWLALHTARARGLNPDRPQHLSKVTQTL
jgi:glucosamine--fructose-6-phosphate aminotransferase (isomerizing)